MISAIPGFPTLWGVSLFSVLYLPLISARNSFVPLVSPHLHSAMSVPLTAFLPAAAASRQRMGPHHLPAAAPWTRRRARALCCTRGWPPASAVSPSSTAPTATMTCRPRPCPGTRQSPARREHSLIPPASSSRPGFITSCPSQQGGGHCPSPQTCPPQTRVNSPLPPIKDLVPLEHVYPVSAPHLCPSPPPSHTEPLPQFQAPFLSM